MSLQIILSDLSFSYSSALEVLKDASLSLSPGWTGVVGVNGSGKTTLLRLLAGELATGGSMLQRIPAHQVIRYCPQRVGDISPSIQDLAERWDRPAQRIMGKLALDALPLARWPSLSPGERKRWQIASALADSPDLLLLDEPTNHLDTEAKNLLTEELKGFQGIGVLVSHDRGLLDLLTSQTLRISAGAQLRAYAGNYTAAREVWQREEGQVRESLDQLQSTRRKLKKRLDSTRQSHGAAQKNTSTGSRMKSIRDSDARSMAAKGRAASGEQSLGRQVTVLGRELDRAQEAVKEVRLEKDFGRSVFILQEPAPKANLVHMNVPEIRRGGQVLLKEVDVMVRRDSRIHLQGPNGSGKTTLMLDLLQASSLPEERILYLPQELSGEEIARNGEEMRALPDDKKGRLLQIVAALGLSPERLLASESPSPGEARKLALAMGLTRQAWLLMLDEPTNHLDLPSIERIEEALKEYSSALVLVTHDARFAGALTDESWRIQEGRVSQGPIQRPAQEPPYSAV